MEFEKLDTAATVEVNEKSIEAYNLEDMRIFYWRGLYCLGNIL